MGSGVTVAYCKVWRSKYFPGHCCFTRESLALYIKSCSSKMVRIRTCRTSARKVTFAKASTTKIQMLPTTGHQCVDIKAKSTGLTLFGMPCVCAIFRLVFCTINALGPSYFHSDTLTDATETSCYIYMRRGCICNFAMQMMNLSTCLLYRCLVLFLAFGFCLSFIGIPSFVLFRFVSFFILFFVSLCFVFNMYYRHIDDSSKNQLRAERELTGPLITARRPYPNYRPNLLNPCTLAIASAHTYMNTHGNATSTHHYKYTHCHALVFRRHDPVYIYPITVFSPSQIHPSTTHYLFRFTCNALPFDFHAT